MAISAMSLATARVRVAAKALESLTTRVQRAKAAYDKLLNARAKAIAEQNEARNALIAISEGRDPDALKKLLNE